jgi:hypothetical protein
LFFVENIVKATYSRSFPVLWYFLAVVLLPNTPKSLPTFARLINRAGLKMWLFACALANPEEEMDDNLDLNLDREIESPSFEAKAARC